MKHKFSLIIPAYNVEKYIKKCLDSVLNQTYNDYEIIIINDGSTDNTSKLLESYKSNKKIKIINQENKGLSNARNTGVSNAKGDYILFIDSDDFIEKELLEILNKTIKDEDLVRFHIRILDETNKIIKEYKEETFNNLNGIEAFNKLSKYNLVELAVCYAYKKDTFLKNNYKFEEKTYHEDFGLIPYIIISSKKVTSINYIGYNYLQRKNSIMNNTDYEKEIKKSNDVLKHYKNLIKWSQNIEGDLTIYKSFIANSVILKSLNLKEKDYKNYIKKLKEYKVYDNLLTNNKENKIKKILIKISPKLYYKIIRGLK